MSTYKQKINKKAKAQNQNKTLELLFKRKLITYVGLF